VSILQDPKLQDGFMTKPDVRGTDGDRVYGEMNTGVWWEDTQKQIPDVKLTDFLQYFDLIYG
jgi:hypothetical protein